MKKQQYILGTVLAMALAGCSEDVTEKVITPVQTGDEIVFGSAISKENNMDAKGIDLRTIYGDRTPSGIPVYWDPDNADDIAIFCPQVSAPSDKIVTYTVAPQEKNPATSATVTKAEFEQIGLQWGTEDEHKFYALYPASRLKDATSDPVNKHGRLTTTIPTNQKPAKWVIGKPSTAYSTIPADANIHFGLPDMDNAYMWAHSHVFKSQMDKEKAISLQFHNLVTVLDITIPGPENPEDQVTVTNINVESADPNDEMTGDFYFYIKDGEVDSDGNKIPMGRCEPVPTKFGEVRNTISIPCMKPNASGKLEGVTLKGPNEYLNVKAYIVPDNRKNHEQFYRNLKFTVSMLNGAALTKTLTKVEQQPLIPQKVNRIMLPRLRKASPALWMSNLDPNVYLTELSIPGSKMSYLTAKNGATGQGGTQGIPAYQTKDIKTQFSDGVRAFIVQTGISANYDRDGWFGKFTLNKEGISMPIVGAGRGITIENALNELKAALDAAKAEQEKKQQPCLDFAFLMLTADFSANSSNYKSQVGDFRLWMEGAAEKLRQLAKNPAYSNLIYTGKVDANTTLDDVKGKIVIKLNFNDNSQKLYVNETVPALFSLWESPKGNYNITNLYWGTFAETSNPLKWMYQEVTYVPKEATEAAKEASALKLFQESVTKYHNDDSHSTWFMNDMGGAYMNANGVLQNEPTTRIATKFNNLAIDALQKRGDNASTGIVFINFADRDPNSGGKYRSDYILSTIIDNNFKFNLRKKGSTNTQP